MSDLSVHIEQSRASLEKIGDGDWTPQDTLHQRLVIEAVAALESLREWRETAEELGDEQRRLSEQLRVALEATELRRDWHDECEARQKAEQELAEMRATYDFDVHVPIAELREELSAATEALRSIADGEGGHSYENTCRVIARQALGEQ